jgi:alpha-tubulin suppressor-like RCC1 family protein
VVGLSDVSAVAMSNVHTCALETNGTVLCWGRNDEGEIGDGTSTFRATPTPASGLSGVAKIACGFEHTCAVKTDGTVLCWGDNDKGQLGDGTQHGVLSSPTPVPSLTSVSMLGLGGYHSCALKTDGTVVCWGDNDYAQLGDGTTTRRLVPTPVLGLSGVAQVVAGDDYTCALKTDGTVLCWGVSGGFLLGAGGFAQAPVPYPGLSNVIQLGRGHDHVCALKADGTVVCWDSVIWPPRLVPNLSSVVELAGGSNGYYECALRTDGTVLCWDWSHDEAVPRLVHE